MRRREFITLIGGTVAWPLAARGQKSYTSIAAYDGVQSSYSFSA